MYKTEHRTVYFSYHADRHIGEGVRCLHMTTKWKPASFLSAAVFVLMIVLLRKPLLPFACALIFAALLQKPHRYLMNTSVGRLLRRHKKRGGSTVWATVLVIGSTVIGGGLMVFGVSALLDEAARLIGWLGDYLPLVTEELSAFVDRITTVLTGWAQKSSGSAILTEQVKETLSDVLPQLLSALLSWMTSAASEAVSAVIGALPHLLLFFAVFLIASIGMTAEYERVITGISHFIPRTVRQHIPTVRRMLGGITKGVMRAYLILAALTYLMLTAGFFLLGVSFPLGAAALGLFFDLLPVIGVGTLLLPWALASFRSGKIGFACGLLVLYLLISIVRRILEGKLIGHSIGVHPLAALFALYAGGMLFGIVGMLLAPFAAALLWRGYCSRYEIADRSGEALR